MTPDRILDFWFDRPGHAARGEALTPLKQWWTKDAAYDEAIRIRFATATSDAIDGAFTDWVDAAGSALALVILLDQFPRNLFRGSARSFAGDARALDVAYEAVRSRFDTAVLPVQRQFFYMPFQHSETLADQMFGMPLFAALETELPGYDTLLYAERHRDIIARFGRFPHRNAVLGRASTDEEEAFLRQPGSSF